MCQKYGDELGENFTDSLMKGKNYEDSVRMPPQRYHLRQFVR